MLDLSTMNFVAELHPQKIGLRNPGADKSKVFENCIWWGREIIFFFFTAEQCWKYFLGYLVNNFYLVL